MRDVSHRQQREAKHQWCCAKKTKKKSIFPRPKVQTERNHMSLVPHTLFPVFKKKQIVSQKREFTGHILPMLLLFGLDRKCVSKKIGTWLITALRLLDMFTGPQQSLYSFAGAKKKVQGSVSVKTSLVSLLRKQPGRRQDYLKVNSQKKRLNWDVNAFSLQSVNFIGSLFRPSL